MARSPGKSSFESAQLGLGSSGEVRIGAYARRQRRQRMMVGAVGVALIAAAIVMYVKLRPHFAPDDPDRYPVVVKCDVCGHTQEIEVPFGQRFPTMCQECGGLAGRPVWQCRDCGARFAPDQTGSTARCPQCDSLAVGSAVVP